MTIRPGKKYSGIVKKIQDAASQSGRSMNNYVLHLIDNHFKNTSTNEQITALPSRGSNDSETLGT